MLAVARYLVTYVHRPGSQQQFRSLSDLISSLSSNIEDILNWIRGNAASIANIEQIAGHFNMSLRTFHRNFQKQTGETPAKFLEKVRVEIASELLRTTKQTLKVIADVSGLTRLNNAIHRHYQFAKRVSKTAQSYFKAKNGQYLF